MSRRFVAALLALGVVAPVPARSAVDGPPVEIEAMLSLTGPGAFFGASAAKTLKVIETLTNESGGINGRPVKFVVEDDGSNPQTALQIANQLIARKVPATLGPSLTVTCQAIVPIVAAHGPVTFCLSPSVVTPPGSYAFANGSTQDDGLATVLRYFRERGLTRIAVLNGTDASGQAVDKTLDTVFALPENKSITVVAHQHFAPSDISVTAQLTQIKAANPQAVISWAVGTPFGTVLRGLNDVGLDVPILTGAGNMTFAQMQQYAAFLPKRLLFSAELSMAPGADVPKPIRDAQAVFFRGFKAAGIVPDAPYGGIYDMAMIYVQIYRKYNGAPTADQVHDYIENIRGYAGVNGTFDFRAYPQHGLGQDSDLIEQWNAAKGAFVPVSKPGGYR